MAITADIGIAAIMIALATRGMETTYLHPRSAMALIAQVAGRQIPPRHDSANNVACRFFRSSASSAEDHYRRAPSFVGNVGRLLRFCCLVVAARFNERPSVRYAAQKNCAKCYNERPFLGPNIQLARPCSIETVMDSPNRRVRTGRQGTRVKPSPSSSMA